VKRILSLCLVLLFSAISLSYGQENSPSANSGKKVAENANAELIAARAATKEKRYADSEALMLKATASQPELILPWVELGLAQLGLKK